jgi:hypothetical protein
MVTFDDLQFVPHPLGGTRARWEFDNGYGISVVHGPLFYCDEDTFEVAILKDDRITYDTPLTNDVLGYQTSEDINNILKELESYAQ